MSQNPLVSVSVITYNSSRYILETLESAKAQTYSPLELVISDDCSTDDTIAICRQWIAENKERFVDTKIIISPTNRGISANYNQGMDNCSGEYIKEIAGDDVLLPNCIEDYIRYTTGHPDAYFCFGKAVIFDGDEERRTQATDWFNYNVFKLSPEEQYKHLMTYGNFICSATYFYDRHKASEYNIRNDEAVPYIEDWPKWINILRSGNRLSFLNKEVIKYRLSDTSLSTQHNPSPFWLQQKAIFFLKYIVPFRELESPRRAWRLKQYALQTIRPSWWRKLIIDCYEIGARLSRLMTNKQQRNELQF